MIFHCYTLTIDDIVDGIDPSAHDCVISTAEDRVVSASVDIVPIMPDALDPQLNVSFISAAAGTENASGAIVAFNPAEWRLAYVDSRVALIDGSSHAGQSLVVLAAGLDNVLACVSDASKFLSLTDKGIPHYITECRARLMHEAITPALQGNPERRALVPYGISPEASPASEAPLEKARRTRRRTSPAS